MKKSLFLLLLSAVIIQGCSNARPNLPDLPSLSNEVDLHKDWRTSVDGNFGETSERFSLVAENDKLYFVTDQGTLYTLNQADGDEIHEIETGYAPSSGVTLQGDSIYFGTYDAQLVAVSLTNKSVLWEKSLSSEVLSEAAYAAGKIAIQTADGWLNVLEADSGNTLWRAKQDLPALTVRGTSSPVIANGKVVAGFADGQVKAFSLQSGEELWSYAAGKPEGRYEIERLSDVDGRLVVKDNVVYAVAYNGTLVALALETGRPLWQRNIASSVGVAVNGELLVAVDMKSNVIALNAKNGSEVWKNSDLLDRDLISPEFFGDYVALMDRAGYVHLIDLGTGAVMARELANEKNVAPGSRMLAHKKQLFILTPDSDVTSLTY
ncbi:outer membrane protein assembly factor BamB [Marinomonas aquiplantarum]|uniref:Outer membrane protein assembly factor BamB n=1 Tax=Marinomonas aquiplantarum TaxID=491951 RepID=A0A366D480_9GAMM|nr:outer membrane protein assembly factor BamB [Marinomonas aquiplantarum]RBO84118.1 Beta-barrel assembly machine subunit BamB [Marinomonas aquiplantarum]